MQKLEYICTHIKRGLEKKEPIFISVQESAEALWFLQLLSDKPFHSYRDPDKAVEIANEYSLFSQDCQYIFYPDGWEKERIDSIVKASKERGWRAVYIFEKKMPGIDGVIAIDTLSEKPWERKDRQIAMIQKHVQKHGKRFSEGALHLFFDRPSLLFVEYLQDAEMLITFTGPIEQITEKELSAVYLRKAEYKYFDIARQVVWEKEYTPYIWEDRSDLFAFFGLLRYHIELGIALSKDPQQLPKKYEKLTPKQRGQFLEKIKEHPKWAFTHYIQILIHAERLLRMDAYPPEILWDMVQLGMRKSL